MSHNTSVSLDPESARLAQRMKREGKNFSRFVRECLHLYYRDDNGGEHLGEVVNWPGCDPYCLPTRAHFCRVCWPVGTPPIEALGAARVHVAELDEARSSKHRGLVRDNLIPDLWSEREDGATVASEEKGVLEWLRDRAEDHNRFIMPLANLDLEGNAKAAKTKKAKKGLIRRILTEMGR